MYVDYLADIIVGPNLQRLLQRSPRARIEAEHKIAEMKLDASLKMAHGKYSSDLEFRPIDVFNQGPYALHLDYVEGRIHLTFKDKHDADVGAYKLLYSKFREVMSYWWALRDDEKVRGGSASLHEKFDRARISGHDDFTGCLRAELDRKFEIGGYLMCDIGTLLLIVVPDRNLNPLYRPGVA